MNSARLIVAFWIAACTSLFAHQDQRDANTQKQPNIVVLIADDLGWGDISLHKGSVQTPNIDRLAQDGVELERYYTYPLCSPTRAALLTGMMPKRYGITRALGPRELGLPAGLPTLPRTLQSAGYQTWMVGKWHTGTASPPRQTGFDHFYGFLGPEIDYFQHTGRGGVDWQRNEQTVNESGYSTHLIAAEAKRLLKERDHSRPFYLQVAFNAPHFPLAAPTENTAKYSQLAPAAATRAGVIDALDIAIGDILMTLDDLGIANNTLVVFLSDNGADQTGSNSPYRGAKFSVFEGGIHVPCFMRWPSKLKAHTSSKQAVTAHDLYPTLLAAAGVAQTVTADGVQKLDGINLWSSIANGKLIERDPFVIAADNTAIFDGDWKMVETSTGLIGLYNLIDDPGETLDLSFREIELVKNLQSKLELVKLQFPVTNARARPGRRR